MLLSFIIPLYNCEPYISACLDSIFQVDIAEKDFEVIIIDDGSVDKGITIAQEYQKQHPNIVILQQPNLGVSIARNRGLERAKGKWIWFIDADDRIWIKGFNSYTGQLQHFLNSDEIDLICFNYVKDYGSGIEYVTEVKSEEILSGLMFLEKSKALYLWDKIFNRKSVGVHRFIDGTKNLEDMFFDLITIIDMTHVICIPMYGYVYNQCNLTSTSRNRELDNLLKLSMDTQLIHKKIQEEIFVRSGRSRYFLCKALSISGVGYLYSLIKFYPRRIMLRELRNYQAQTLYPVKQTGVWKYDLFLLIANHRMGMYLLNVFLRNR